MSAQIADEPELVRAIARLTFGVDPAHASEIRDICAACFDAGYANGVVAKFTPASTVVRAMERVRGIVPREPEEPFR